MRPTRSFPVLLLSACSATWWAVGPVAADDHADQGKGPARDKGPVAASEHEHEIGLPVTTYDVTITNLTPGQPFSPPVVAAHRPDIHLFRAGELASPGLRKVAEEGMSDELLQSLAGEVTDVAAATAEQKVMPGKSLTLKVRVRAGDVISTVNMLAATNDGFTGLDGCPVDEAGVKKATAAKVKLDAGKAADEAAKAHLNEGDLTAKDGVVTATAIAFDAGTEENTERKADTAAPEMGKGHPATTPPQPVGVHKGITGGGDLDTAKFGWAPPVARIEIRVAKPSPKEAAK